MIITPKALKERVFKTWQRGIIHRAWLQKQPCFPLEIPLKKISAKSLLTNYHDLHHGISTLRQDSKKQGYSITDKSITHRQLGEQKIPATITFPCEEGFLNYLAKTIEFQRFQSLVTQSLQYDGLFDWLIHYPFKVMQYADEWSKLLTVCQYFKMHPRPDCYIRQLDIKGVDSKFIERHKSILNELLSQILVVTDYDAEVIGLSQHGFERRYGLRYDQPLIRFRILDPSLAIKGITDLTLTLSEFKRLELAVSTVFIVENKISGLAFPDYQDAIVIFGLGYAVNVLAEAACLQGKQLFYWGDLDADGMAILSRLRQYYPQAKSLLMDLPTLEHFSDLVENVPANNAEKSLSFLTRDENNLYKKLQQESLRLEQERISFVYFQKRLDSRKFS